jgi:hypothetical protein
MPDDAAASHEISGGVPGGSRRLSSTTRLTLAVVVAVVLGGIALGVAFTNPAPQRNHPSASCGAGMPKLTVHGTGQATGTPDLLTVVVQVDASGPSATAALSSDNEKAGGVVAAFTTGGVEQKDIQTSGLSLQPQYVYPKGVPTLTGYQVTNSITATLRDIAKAGAAIDAVVGVAGDAVQIESIGFSASNPAVVQDQARARAATQAVLRARSLAEGAGSSLGPVCSVTDQSQASVSDLQGVTYAAAPNAAGSTVPIESGSQTQTAQVSIVYALEPLVRHAHRAR